MTVPIGTPAAEVEVDADLVRALLAEQHPDLAGLPLEQAASGWDNVTFRLGDELAVRLPRRAVAADLLAGEQRWLGAFAARLPLPVPAPVRRGRPGRGYPWPWSVVPWFAGQPADVAALAPGEAPALGRFLRALHRPAPPDAPVNPYRGVPLAERGEAFAVRLAALPPEAGVDGDAVRTVFTAGLAAPAEAASSWLHGDLHPRNVLVAGGRLAAILDWGDLTSGDPATDVAGLWMLLDEEAHAGFWDAYQRRDAALEARARAWAASFGVILLGTGLTDDPRFAAVGRRVLARLIRA